MLFKNYFKLPRFIAGALLTGTVLLGARFFWFTRSFAGTLPYMDQLELYWPFIHNPSPLSLFLYQYGPHRQGMGYILTYAVAAVSQWNIPTEITLNALVQIGTCIALLALKRAVFHRWHITDIFIPLVVFSYRYTESFTIVPNISLAVFPIFLTFLGIYVWFILTTPWKYALTAAIAVIVLFSGFGMLTLPLFALLICVPLFRFPNSDIKYAHIITPLLILISGTSAFFYNYQFDPAVSCQVNPLIDWPVYSSFIGTEVTSYFIRPNSLLPLHGEYLGLTVWISLGILLGLSVNSYWQNNHRSYHGIHIVLLGIPVLFAAASAFARTCLGVEAARAGRYAIFFIPGLISLYFLLLRFKGMLARGTLIAFVSLFMLNEVVVSRGYTEVAKNHYQSMERWHTCYTQHSSIPYCNDVTQFSLIPARMNTMAGEILRHIVR